MYLLLDNNVLLSYDINLIVKKYPDCKICITNYNLKVIRNNRDLDVIKVLLNYMEENKEQFVFRIDDYNLDFIKTGHYLKSRYPELVIITNDILYKNMFAHYNISTDYIDEKEFDIEAMRNNIYLNELEIPDNAFNYFALKDGWKLCFYRNKLDDNPASVSDTPIWKVKPLNYHQQAYLHLLTQEDINLLTTQSKAGTGKTFLALASAFYLTLQKKRYDKILILKPNIEICEKIGFLPGDYMDKIMPYLRYVQELVLKLHSLRPVNKIFIDAKSGNYEFNASVFEILPIQFIRGLNIENCFVFVDEAQNLTKHELKSIISRVGDGKVVVAGDIEQIDRPNLNSYNCGLNLLASTILSERHKNTAHISLNGNSVRGKVCKLLQDIKF